MSVQMHVGEDEEQRTHEHLYEQVAVSVPGVLVPAVGQVVRHVHDNAWVCILPAHDFSRSD